MDESLKQCSVTAHCFVSNRHTGEQGCIEHVSNPDPTAGVPIPLYDDMTQRLSYLRELATQPQEPVCMVCHTAHAVPCEEVDHPRDRYRLVVLMGKSYRWTKRDGRYALMPVLR